jgi:hypothetical protein
MAEIGHTWLVLVRDVSHAVRLGDQPHVFVTAVFDPASQRILSASPGPTAAKSLKYAFETALMTPADPFEPGPPARVMCVPDLVPEVSAEVAALLPAETPPIEPVTPQASFEDILDSVVGLLSGRPQPDGLGPTPEEWGALHQQALRYRQVEPWKRWSIAGQLSLIVRVDSASTRFLAVVIGESTTQRGMILYPGGAVPYLGDTECRAIEHDEAGHEHTEALPPDGTLLFYLDMPDEVPQEYQQRAVRYGWPADADLFPILVTGGPDGPGDIDRTQARHLMLALAAVLDHDANETATTTSGTLELPTQPGGHYMITSVR